MALIKKYENGGSYQNTNPSLEDYLDQRLDELKVTKKAKPLIQKTARKFANLSSLKDFKDIYKYDKLTNTYTVDINRLPEEMRGEIWTGSKDDVDKNIFGQYTAKPDKSTKNSPFGAEKKMNSIVASLLNEYIELYPNKPFNKENRKIANLQDYITKVPFGGNEEIFQTKFESLPNEERYKFLKKYAKDNLDQYLLAYSKDKDKYNFENIEKISDIRRNFDNYTQQELEDKLAELGWGLSGFLKSKQEVEEEDKRKSSLAEQNLLKSKTDALIKAGITPELALNLAQSGFVQESNFDPTNRGWFPGYAKEQGIIVIKDQNGNVRFIKNNEYAGSYKFNRSNMDRFGDYWEQDPYGNIKYKSLDLPGSGWDKSTVWAPQSDFVELEIEGLPEGYVAEGYKSMATDNQPILDRYGEIDYTKHVVIRNPSGEIDKELTWNGSKYIDEAGQEYSSPTIINYGAESNYTNLLEDEYSSIAPQKMFTSFTPVETILKDFKKDKKGNILIGRKDLPQLRTALADLKYRITNARNLYEKENAIKEYNKLKLKLGELKENDINEITTSFVHGKRGARHKFGGIIKAQNGTKVKNTDFERYLRTLKNTKQEETSFPLENAEEPKLKSTSGTLRDADPLEIASLIGTGVSFIPVIGAVGGLTTTVADLAKDWKDGGVDDIWTHVGNIGFTALSLIGFGGLRALKVASKVAKVADTGLDMTKITKNASKLARLKDPRVNIAIKSVDTINDSVKKSKNSKVLLETIKDIAKVGDASKEQISILKKAGISIDNVKDALALQAYAGKGTNVIATKAAKYIPKAVGVGVAASNIKPTLDVIGNIKEDGLVEGIKSSDVQDLKGAMMLASLGKQYIGEAKTVKAINKYKTASKPEYKLKIGESTVSINESIDIPKLPKKGILEKSEEFTKKFDNVKNVFSKSLKDSGLSDNEIVRALKAWEIGKLKTFKQEQPEIAFSNELKDIIAGGSSFQRAKRALDRNFESVYSPLWLLNKKQNLKNGGILKGQNGLIVGNPRLSDEYIRQVYKARTAINPIKSNLIEEISVVGKKPVVTKLQQKGIQNINPPIQISGNPKFSDEYIKRHVQPIPKPLPVLRTEKVDDNLAPMNIKTPQGDYKTIIDEEEFNDSLPVLNTQDLKSGYADKLKTGNFDKLNNVLQYINPKIIGETGAFITSLIANNKIAKLQRSSLAKQASWKPILLEQPFYRASSTANLPYENAAQEMLSKGKILGSTSSDINASNAIQLEGINKANKLQIEGKLAQAKEIEDKRNFQEKSNFAISQANNETMNNYMLRMAEIDSKVPLIQANKILNNYTSLKNFLSSTIPDIEATRSKIDYLNLQKFYDSDKFKNAYNTYNKAIESRAEYEKQFEKRKAEELNTADLDWESSIEKQQYDLAVENAKKNYDLLSKQINLLKYQTYLPTYISFRKSGGVLEKEYLENLKHYNKVQFLKVKEMYKLISESNKLLEKSLIKIFK